MLIMQLELKDKNLLQWLIETRDVENNEKFTI